VFGTSEQLESAFPGEVSRLREMFDDVGSSLDAKIVSEFVGGKTAPFAVSETVKCCKIKLSCGRGDALAVPELMSKTNKPIAKSDAIPKRALKAPAMYFWLVFVTFRN
jgi:hypothetical protein